MSFASALTIQPAFTDRLSDRFQAFVNALWVG